MNSKRSYLTTIDYAVSQEEFHLILNTDLDMLVTTPVPNDLNLYYQSDSYISHTDASKSFTEKLYQLVKRYSLRRKIALLEQLRTTNRTVLDIGSGTGDFLLAAKKKGWSVSGIEPSDRARENALDKGIVLEEDWERNTKCTYQVITLWHVLEHLPNLELRIENIVSLLNEDGTLIVAVPNFRSYDANYYQKYWAAYDVPRHLWHFSQTAIKLLFAKHGLRITQVRPMIFDSFYVSLLSEKYRTGKQNYFKAFCIGLMSNLYAMRSKEYSSLIYILKKR